MTQRAHEFVEAIKPFAPLWRTVRVSLLAAKREDVWLIIATRLLLSPNSAAATRLHIHFDRFFAIDGDISPECVSEVIASLEEKGCLPPLQISGRRTTPACYISPRHAGIPNVQEFNLSWSSYEAEKPYAMRDYGLQHKTIVFRANLQRLTEIVPYKLLEDINAQLRLARRPFDGIQALGAHLITHLQLLDYSVGDVQILAPLPFTTTYKDRSLHVIAPVWPRISNTLKRWEVPIL